MLPWAAGFIDGEGCFYLRKGNYPSLTVCQTELTSLERLQSLFGGNLREINPRGKQKQTWQWDIHGFEKVQQVAIYVWPWLIVKRPQVERVLVTARQHRGRPERRTECKEPGCPKRPVNNGMCSQHYELAQAAAGRVCCEPDCDRGVMALDRCLKHYKALRRREAGVNLAPGLRTHCPQNHEYTSENTRIDNRGRRVCRTCSREATKRWEQNRNQT